MLRKRAFLKSFVMGASGLFVPRIMAADPLRQRRVGNPPRSKANKQTLAQFISSYEAGGSLINAAGLPSASFGSGAAFISGYTVINKDMTAWQDCLITQFKAKISAVGDASQRIKFKHFRVNGANYDFIAESEPFVIPDVGTQTFTPATPFNMRTADILGFSLTGTGTAAGVSTLLYGKSAYVAGDITTTNAFSSESNTANIEGLGKRPFFSMTGDSISEGELAYFSYFMGQSGSSGGPKWANIGYNPAYQTGLSVGTGMFRDFGKAGQTYSWVASTGASTALSVDPYILCILCGVNDVNTNRAWEDVEADLNTIRALTTKIILLCEIIPWTAGSDEKNATIRLWNTNFATWCAANPPAYVVSCHDPLGQIRLTTGFLDDLLVAYNKDGVHLTTSGVTTLANSIASKISQIVP